MAKKPASIPKEWSRFIDEYTSTADYWYFPKGRAVNNVDEIRDILKILKGFEGQRWQDVKPEFLAALTKAKLFQRRAGDQTENDSQAMARVLKIVFGNLGFSWIDEGESVQLTPAGETFIEANDPAPIFDRQLWRYQTYNPLNLATRNLRLFPHPFLVDVMISSERVLTRDEFILFVARARTHDDRDAVIDRIAAWRELTPTLQQAIKDRLDSIPIKKGAGSMFNRLRLDCSYSLAFHGNASYIERNRQVRDVEYALTIRRSQLSDLRDKLRRFLKEAVFIDYASPKDWIAAYGDLENNSTRAEALGYYTDKSNVEKAVQVFKELPENAREGYSEEQFREIQIMERQLEDMLEDNIKVLDAELSLIGRQYETVVGPIDLLANEKDGTFVVIELKKGRAADKVFGQLCRYMGFIKREVAQGKRVRGIIVGRDIDQKLQYAVEAVPKGLVTLKAFDFRLSMQERTLG